MYTCGTCNVCTVQYTYCNGQGKTNEKDLFIYCFWLLYPGTVDQESKDASTKLLCEA